jgi:hypothetical protein
MEPDFNSPTWQWVVERLRAEQTKRRAELESLKGIDETNMLRGQLRTIKLAFEFPEAFKRDKERK